MDSYEKNSEQIPSPEKLPSLSDQYSTQSENSIEEQQFSMPLPYDQAISLSIQASSDNHQTSNDNSSLNQPTQIDQSPKKEENSKTNNNGWNYQFCEFNDIDFQKYEQENLEHLKKVYRPPQLSDVVDKVVEQENGLSVQTLSQFNIPKCNVLSLDMKFLEEWESKEICPQFIMYSPKGEVSSENESSDAMPTIDKKWCRDVQVQFEERDQNGELIDKYRVTKEKRSIKLQGNISIKWMVCLNQLKPNECKWFQMGANFLQQIGHNTPKVETLYLMIKITSVKALALSELKEQVEKQNQSTPQTIIYEDYPSLVQKSEEFNNEGKVFFQFMNYEKAGKFFNKAYSIWRGMTKKVRKTLTAEQEQNYIDKSNQYGANYAQCLMNLKQYQNCVDFYSKTKLNSLKNVFKLSKSLFELHEYEKAISAIDSYSSTKSEKTQELDSISSQEQKIPLPPELENLKYQCACKLNQLEQDSKKNFYQNIFK